MEVSVYKEGLAVHMNLKLRDEKYLAERREMAGIIACSSGNVGGEHKGWRMP